MGATVWLVVLEEMEETYILVFEERQIDVLTRRLNHSLHTSRPAWEAVEATSRLLWYRRNIQLACSRWLAGTPNKKLAVPPAPPAPPSPPLPAGQRNLNQRLQRGQTVNVRTRDIAYNDESPDGNHTTRDASQ